MRAAFSARKTSAVVGWSRTLATVPKFHKSGRPDALDYEFTSKMDLELPEKHATRDAFQILNKEGKLIEGASEPNISKEMCLDMYKAMVKLEVMDGVLYEAQRQGRISFYMQTRGEEAINIGSAAGLQPEDNVFAQYREAGVLLWRGYTLDNFADQCFSNKDDPGQGRQMPMHYGSKELNYHTISSPLTTQLPQAAGAAYAMKSEGPEGRVVAAFFGEGAASEGDFHAGMNFAATLECPIVFICRNNQYAISTPVEDQYRGDGIISRAAGYGMASIRTDGNDILAVQQSIAEARAFARNKCRPVFVELMSYRISHHSTSDDSTAYRDVEEIEAWTNDAHPVPRFRQFLEDRELWDSNQEAALREECRTGVLSAMNQAETKGKPEPLENLFADVYHELTPNLIEQREELKQMVKLYPNHYTAIH